MTQTQSTYFMVWLVFEASQQNKAKKKHKEKPEYSALNVFTPYLRLSFAADEEKLTSLL